MSIFKKLALGLCAFAAVICITTAKPQTAEAASTYYVTTKSVAIRTKAKSTASKVITLPKEAAMLLVEKTNSSWYKVEYQNSKQNVYTGYIPTSAIKLATFYKTSVATRIRAKKSTSSDEVTVVPKSTKVIVVNAGSTWLKVVYYDGDDDCVYRGYMKAEYLNKVVTAVTYKATTSVYMRKSASASSSIVMVVPEGVKVSVTSTANSKWYKVSYTNSKGNTYTGYIYSKYLKKV